PEPERAGLAVAHGPLELALDRRPLRRDLHDVAVAHLLEEERAVGNAHPRVVVRRPRGRPVVEAEEDEREEDEPPAEAPPPLPRRLRRRAAARRLDAPARVLRRRFLGGRLLPLWAHTASMRGR